MENREKWEYPGSEPSQGNQIIVSYNGDWLPILSGLAMRIASPELWLDAPPDIQEELNDLIYQLSKTVKVPDFPNNAFIMPPQMTIDVGTGLVFSLNTTARFNGFWQRETPVQNDSMSIYFLLAAGDYELEYAYAKSSGQGQCHLTCQELSYAETIDQYNATTQLGQTFTDTFTCPEDTTLRFIMIMSTKNASSSGYQQNWFYLALRAV